MKRVVDTMIVMTDDTTSWQENSVLQSDLMKQI